MRKQRLQRFLKQITQILFILLFLLPITNYQLLITNVYAEIPHLISYQGKLVDSSGKPLHGSYKITFRIYDALSGSNLLWEEIHQTTLDKGLLSVMLGSFNNGNAPSKELKDLSFNQPYYLSMQIEGDPEEMSPRQRLASSGYAFMAENATQAEKVTGVVPIANGGTGSATDNLVYDGNAAGGDLTGTYPNPTIPTTIPKSIQVFTSTGTWTKPAGISTVYVKVWGGGGGGDGPQGAANISGSGGGGGGYAEGNIAVSGNVTVTIGAGGASNAAGGTSSFAGSTTIQATGGGAGQAGGGGAGGTGSGGTINLTGGAGTGRGTTNSRGGPGSAAPLGGGGGGGGGSNGNGAGGAGAVGCVPGGGGGGGGSGSTAGGLGGDGGDGLVIVYY